MPACLPPTQHSKEQAEQTDTLMPWTFFNFTPRFHLSMTLDSITTSPYRNEKLQVKQEVNQGSNLRLEQDSHFLVKSRFSYHTKKPLWDYYRETG